MLSSDIRSRLSSYLAREMSLEQFEEWFIPATWQVHTSGDLDAVELAGTIKLRLAEFTNGHWTEDELREQLIPLVTRYEIRTADAVLTTSSAEIIVPIILQPTIVSQRSDLFFDIQRV